MTPIRSPFATVKETSFSAASSPCTMRLWTLRMAYSLKERITSFGTLKKTETFESSTAGSDSRAIVLDLRG